MDSISYHLALPIIALLCGFIGAVCDVWTRRIPNLLTGSAMLIGLGMHFAAGGWREAGSSLAALLLCGAIFMIFYLAGGMGAGDVKLIAAEGCLLGLSNAAYLLALTAIAGGILAVLLAVRHGRLGQTLRNVLALTAHHGQHGLAPHPELNVLNSATLRLPYALAIAAGAVLTVYLQFSQVRA